MGLTTQGADLAVLDVNGNGRPEIFFGWIDAPDGVNQGYYRVGWDLDANGNVASWGADPPQKIAGAFGSQDSGLGLTLDDMNSDGQPELVAAWVRNGDGGNEWAYAVGEDLGQDGLVGSWAPGLPIAGWVGGATAAASLASADLVGNDGRPELVVSWIDHPTTGDVAWLRVGQTRPLGGDPDQYPTAVTDTDPTDGVFQVQFQGQLGTLAARSTGAGTTTITPCWSVWAARTRPGRWTNPSSSHTPPRPANRTTSRSAGKPSSWAWTSKARPPTASRRAAPKASVGRRAGIWRGSLQACRAVRRLARATSTPRTPTCRRPGPRPGEKQAYMVLDYIVPYIGPIASAEASATALGITPGVPLIASPTHPDPDVWYPTNTVAFTWAQPAGDPAAVDGYRWYLDRHPDTVPNEFSQGMTNTITYEDFADGLWYLHLRRAAMAATGVLRPTARCAWTATRPRSRSCWIPSAPPTTAAGTTPP